MCAAVWFVLFLVVAGLTLVALPLAFADLGHLRDSPGAVTALADPSEGMAALLIMLLLPVVWGGLFAFLLVATGAMAGLSLVFVVRAMNPDYAAEKLSYTTVRDDVMGGPRVSGVGMSLQPVRSTLVSDFLVRAYWAGWKPSLKLYLGATILGAAYLFTVGWVYWPAEGLFWQLVCGTVSLTLLAWGGHRYHRGFNERPGPERMAP